MSTFPGFTSRWMTPLRCANSSASAMSAAMRAASIGGMRAVPVDQVAEGLAVDVLHHDEGRVVLLAPVVHRDDVRVVQARGRLGLAPEPFDERRVGRERRVRAPSPRPAGSAAGRARGTRRPSRRVRPRSAVRSGSRRRARRWPWSRQSRCEGSGDEPSWLAQQCQEHLPGDRRGDLASGRVVAVVAAVLDEHRHREPRIVGRGKGDEPRVWCLALDAGLRGTRLARRRPRCRSARRSRCRARRSRPSSR